MENGMKKILTIMLLGSALSVNAFWGANNFNANTGNNNAKDNGFFSYNPYDYWNPRWYPQEMENMLNEFDGNSFFNNNNNNNYGYNPYQNQRAYMPQQRNNRNWYSKR
jgi:hypothetical protein